jgi:SAM-dependent methyltransferase
MGEREAPDFSPLAERYARARPRYPEALYSWLASLVDRRELAWDAATGNGQAAVGLAEHFARVVGTDRSSEQLRFAAEHPRVSYRAAPSEASGLDPGSVDLATSAAALHWFDHPAYFAEVRRVVRPGGVLAAWTYHAGTVDPPFDRVFGRFYHDIVRPWFADGARYVDEGYETIEMPGAPIAAPPFAIEVDWTFEQLLDYLSSWSAVASFRATRGSDPVDGVRDELAALFPEPGEARRLRMPLFVRARRLGGEAGG